ncbi:MAG: helix-turn-helix transcriptional regulator [Roseburia sp.]|nr:helix-turn-helix transcriptional regulator [Roseburia sp.]
MKNKLIPKVLKEYRKKNKYTVDDVSLLLSERSIKAAPKTIYGWESGQSQPSADTLLTLCELYNIDNILGTFGYSDGTTFHLNSQERALIKSYRAHPELQDAVNILLQYRNKSE